MQVAGKYLGKKVLKFCKIVWNIVVNAPKCELIKSGG